MTAKNSTKLPGFTTLLEDNIRATDFSDQFQPNDNRPYWIETDEAMNILREECTDDITDTIINALTDDMVAKKNNNIKILILRDDRE